MINEYRKNFFRWRLPANLEQEFRMEKLPTVNLWLRSGMFAATIFTWLGSLSGIVWSPYNTEKILWNAAILQAVFIIGILASLTQKTLTIPQQLMTPFGFAVTIFTVAKIATAILPIENTTAIHTSFVGIILISYFFERLLPHIGLLTGIAGTAAYIFVTKDIDFLGASNSQRYFHLVAANLIGFGLCYAHNRMDRINYLLEKEVAVQHKEMRSLLNRVFPESISNQLTQYNKAIAEHIPAVTILFADLVGFTKLTTRTQPQELLNLLDDLFREFDAIAEDLGIEKIKTIGDAYMAACGCPNPDIRHAEKIAKMALRLPNAVGRINKKYETNLTIRIGVHTGTVIAGVIGEKRYGYDLWGDAVNIASRLESMAQPGGILISSETRALLGPEFETSESRTLEIKGRGAIEAHELLDHRSQDTKITDFPFAS